MKFIIKRTDGQSLILEAKPEITKKNNPLEVVGEAINKTAIKGCFLMVIPSYLPGESVEQEKERLINIHNISSIEIYKD